MADKITAGLLNLSHGCAQEGLPLIFGLERGGMVTFTVGSATGSMGGTADISVDMQGGEGQVASAQVDLLFDSSVIDIDDPASHCTLDPRLSEQMLLATLPANPPAAPGLQRLRLFVGDVKYPMMPIADGRLVTCTFQVKSRVSDVVAAVAADHLAVSDLNANRFGCQAVAGALSIVSPVPGCAGDCDGDGEVLVTEVTRVVRILAGMTSLSECPAADADGDGDVFVTDVTRAVLNLAYGCPQ